MMKMKRRILIVASFLAIHLVFATFGIAGVLSHWSFNEGSGTVASDSTPNEYDGTLFGASWAVDGWNGGAIYLSEDEDHVESISNDPFELAQGTWECYVKFERFVDTGIILEKDGIGYGNDLLVYTGQSGSIGVTMHTDPYVSVGFFGSTSLTTGRWYHVMVSWGTEGLRLYVDGELDGN